MTNPWATPLCQQAPPLEFQSSLNSICRTFRQPTALEDGFVIPKKVLSFTLVKNADAPKKVERQDLVGTLKTI